MLLIAHSPRIGFPKLSPFKFLRSQTVRKVESCFFDCKNRILVLRAKVEMRSSEVEMIIFSTFSQSDKSRNYICEVEMIIFSTFSQSIKSRDWNRGVEMLTFSTFPESVRSRNCICEVETTICCHRGVEFVGGGVDTHLLSAREPCHLQDMLRQGVVTLSASDCWSRTFDFLTRTLGIQGENLARKQNHRMCSLWFSAST